MKQYFNDFQCVAGSVFHKCRAAVKKKEIALIAFRQTFWSSTVHILTQKFRQAHKRSLSIAWLLLKLLCYCWVSPSPPWQATSAAQSVQERMIRTRARWNKWCRHKRKSCLSHAYGASPHGTGVSKSHAYVMPKGLSCMAPRSLQHAFTWCGFTMFLRPFLLF